MKTYEYRGFDGGGRPCRGVIEAMSVKDARERLAAAGTLAERIAVVGLRARFPADMRAMVYRELSSLLAAGVPMVRAFDNLIQAPETADARALLAGVRDRIREGASLAEALAGASDAVTAFEKAVIQAAEHAATVDLMLDRLAAFLDDQERLRAKVQAALIYPVIVLAVGVCVAILMLGLLVPRARDLLAGGNTPLPALTRWMIGLGALLAKWGAIALVAAVGAVLYVRRRLRVDRDFSTRWDRMLFRLPVWGRGYGLLVNLRFARTLAILLHGGVSALEGLVLAAKATGSVWIAREAEREAETVRHGSSLSEALRRIPPLATTLPGWIQIGEASGGLERLLDNAARRCEDQWERFVSRSLSLLEPLLILVIGGFVLLVTLSVLLPVISLTHSMTR